MKLNIVVLSTKNSSSRCISDIKVILLKVIPFNQMSQKHPRKLDTSYILSKISDGYAYNKLIYDELGNPIDYEFIEVNSKFEEMFGLQKEAIIGNRASHYFSNIRDDDFDWIEYFGLIVSQGAERSIEQHFKPLNEWYQVTVFSTEGDYFVTLFSEIGKHYRATDQLREHSRILSHNVEPQLWVMIDVDTYGTVNEAHAEFIGLDQKDIEFHKMNHVLCDEMLEVFVEGNKKVFESGTQIETRNWLISAFEDIVYLSILRTPVLDTSGNVEHVLCSAVDITELKISEDLLKKSEGKYRNLLFHANDLLYSLDLSGIVIFASPTWTKLLGYEIANVIHRPLKDFVHTDDHCILLDHLDLDSMKCNEIKEFDIRFITTDGSIKWFNIKEKGVINEHGNLISITGVASEITKRVRIERELLDSKLKLNIAQNAARLGEWEYDPSTDELVWSRECAEIFGLNEKEFEGTFSDFIKRVHPDDRDTVIRHSRDIIDINKCYPLEYEHRIIRNCGETIWVREVANTFYDDKSKKLKTIGYIIDINEQKKLEIEFEIIEKKVNYMKKAPIGMFISKVDGEIIEVNDIFVQILGYEHDVLVGMNILDFLAPESLDKGRELIKGLETIKSHEDKLIFLDINGNMLYIHTSLVNVSDSHYLWLFIDDSKYKKYLTDLKGHKEEISTI